MKYFEYLHDVIVVYRDSDSDSTTFQETLNKLGLQGWELVQVVSVEKDSYLGGRDGITYYTEFQCVFKREMTYEIDV